MNNIKLFLHAGSGNHGCEAIVRSTAKILKKNITLYSSHPEQDVKYHIDDICKVEADLNEPVKRGSLKWFFSSIETKLLKKYDLLFRFVKKDFLSGINKGDILLSIGGDNYCYGGTDIISAIHNNIRKKGAKTVLWGCSVEPELLNNPEIAKDISKYSLITARETISYEVLKKVNPNTVLVADPAFTLDRVDLPLPEGFAEGNTVGINASPLIMQNGKSGELVLDAYKELIKRILDTTDCQVALIPHVVCEGNDDREPLRVLLEKFKDTGRVILIEDHNCMELKGFIARCRFFIGARTHATIAAYSSCVPTLVLGYSVKSRGIAKDLFGTEENYVLPVQNMTSDKELADGFTWLLNNENEIKTHLRNIMPEYIKKAYLGLDKIRNLKDR